MEQSEQIFCDVNRELSHNQQFIKLREFLQHQTVIPVDSIFLIDKPIMESSDYEYSYKSGFLLLIKNYKVIFLTLESVESEDFIRFQEDFLEDTGALARRFDYVKLIGRTRNWKSENLISEYSIQGEFDINQMLTMNRLDEIRARIANLIISLLTGSINNILNFHSDSFSREQTLLETVKNRITLFDTNQTRFVYSENPSKSIIRIQGLAGSGKTELLLHKLKKLYVEEKGSRIAFTCFNKILADKLRGRIPEFFDYMKVDEQINYNRLFIASSWGSGRFPDSGLYSKICYHYGLTFQPFSRGKDKREIWNEAIIELKSLGNFEPMFDYILIDESQDFEKEYIELCEMVTARKIYVAGDILQDIFSINKDFTEVETDFLLNKVYRTDPRTILFSHILGFGLYESRAVRWLSDQEWRMSGYSISNHDYDVYDISREPLNRFGDEIDENSYNSITVKRSENYVNDVIESVGELIKEHKDSGLQASDIAIIFTNYNKTTSLQADYISSELYSKFKFKSVIAPHERRLNDIDEILITNVNNVKGLEFSFVIVVNNYPISEISDSKLAQEVRYRNALYMTLTRSFISSTFIISEDCATDGFITKIEELADNLNKNGANISIKKPDNIIEETQLYSVSEQDLKSQEEIIEECFAELYIEHTRKEEMRATLITFPPIKEGTTDKNEILKLIRKLESIF